MLRGARHSKHDKLQLRASAIPSEAITEKGATPSQLYAFSYFQLILIMPLNTSHRLVQSIGSSMLMIRTLEKMFMKYDERLLHRIFRTVQVPIMAGVPTLNSDISIIHQNDIEVLRIDFLKATFIKHRHHPFLYGTRPPMPALQYCPPYWDPFQQSIFSQLLQAPYSISSLPAPY